MDEKKCRPEFSLSGLATGILGGRIGGFHAEVSHRYFESCARLEVELENVFFLARPDLVPRHRLRYEVAVGVIGKFLSESGIKPHVVAEFLELSNALADLNNGTVHPMLAPMFVDNRRPDRTELWTTRAHVVIAAECLISSGMRKSHVCKEIGKRFSSLQFALTPAKNAKSLAGAVSKWIDSFRAGRVKNDLAAMHYRDRQKLIELWADKLKIRDFRVIGENILMESVFFAARASDEGARDKFVSAQKRKAVRRPSRAKTPPLLGHNGIA